MAIEYQISNIHMTWSWACFPFPSSGSSKSGNLPQLSTTNQTKGQMQMEIQNTNTKNAKAHNPKSEGGKCIESRIKIKCKNQKSIQILIPNSISKLASFIILHFGSPWTLAPNSMQLYRVFSLESRIQEFPQNI
jgi:hypothetical protein